MAKQQDGGLVWQASKLFELGKLAMLGNVKEGFFHSRVYQGESLLYEVHPEHGLLGK